MPEGDAIHRATAALRSALVDEKMVRFEAPRLIGLTPRAGRTIERVECHGRHVEIEWDDDTILDTNLRLRGSWFVHRIGDVWQRPHHELRVLIEVDGWVAVCFNAPMVETYRRPDPLRHPGLRGLGPDLSRADADLVRCAQALVSYEDPAAPLAAVLLDQRVLCGLGNVYRCELLWAGQLNPSAPVGDLSEREVMRMIDVAAKLVRANLRHAERIALPGVDGGLAVYGRSGQACQRCATTIVCEWIDGRPLYWCPGCQTRLAPPASPTPAWSELYWAQSSAGA